MISPITYYLATLLVSFFLYVKWRQSYWMRRGLVQLNTELFFGNMRQTITGKISISEAILMRYKYLKSLNHKHCGLYGFLEPVYFAIDPSIIKNIMQKDFPFFQSHGIFHHPKDILTMNLFNLKGEGWKQLRAKLTPTFTSGKMKMMFETLVDKSRGLENVIDGYALSKEPVAIKDVLGRYTTDIIGSCAFGIECNSLDDPACPFRVYGKKIFASRRLKIALISILPWELLGNLGFKSHGRDVTVFFSNIVRETIKFRETNGISRNDFMQLLIELKNNTHSLTEDEIIAQCYGFFLAGFEASASAMTFTLLELANNQVIQRRTRNEINQVLEKHHGRLSYDAVNEMEYLDKVVCETLRKFPPFPALSRVCTKTYTVSGTDVVIEKGTRVQIPIWGLHMDPEYYPNPEVFNPENFSLENKTKRLQFTYLPFGYGPRMCIGLKFGILQTKVGLIALLRKFNFTVNNRTEFPIEMEKGNAILSVKGGVWLDATKL